MVYLGAIRGTGTGTGTIYGYSYEYEYTILVRTVNYLLLITEFLVFSQLVLKVSIQLSPKLSNNFELIHSLTAQFKLQYSSLSISSTSSTRLVYYDEFENRSIFARRELAIGFALFDTFGILVDPTEEQFASKHSVAICVAVGCVCFDYRLKVPPGSKHLQQ